MKALEAAPGVIQKSTRLFIMKEDVEKILGCGKSKAYDVLKEVNRIAKKKGMQSFPMGRANKYLFAELYYIPVAEVDRVINEK